jgi:hypothetical protein
MHEHLDEPIQELRMARIRMEAVVDHLDREFKQAIQAAIAQSGAAIDAQQFYVTFRQKLVMSCKAWESVPDRCVEPEH